MEDQRAFDEKFSLGFPLLSDPDHTVCDAWGTWGEKSLYGNTYLGVIRSSFLVGPDGLIREAWYKVAPEADRSRSDEGPPRHAGLTSHYPLAVTYRK